MNTPICDFVAAYAASGAVRAHMPGHKGVDADKLRDITEIDGAGVLYSAWDGPSDAQRDIIQQSEQNAAALFHTGKTLYSTEGASLCIRAMLYLALVFAREQGRSPLILAGRNAHKAFLTGAALLDLPITWLLPESGSVLSCEITPEALEARLCAMEETPTAVYITSPDYLGMTADIPALACVCHRHACLLLVDNAHGAYLNFLPQNRHPIALGADLCCDSAHKTLPVLTGGAYLHLAKQLPDALTAQAESAMQLFASTSPSYLILQSLDAANAALAGDYPARLRTFCSRLGAWMDRLTRHGYALLGDEPMKLCVDAKAYGYLGVELAAFLRQKGIECEFSDPDVAVLMLSPENSEDDLRRIEQALLSLEKRPAIRQRPPALPAPVLACSPRQALLGPSVALAVDACAGRILAQPSVGCPPAVPIAVCGERLQPAHLALFRYYGVTSLRVCKA